MEIWEIILLIGSLAGAILSIWALLAKFNAQLEGRVRKVVKEELAIYSESHDKELALKLDSQQKILLKDIDGLGYKVDRQIKSQEGYIEADKIEKSLMKSALIETYKQDIRDIYYKLRESGEIEDKDKAYVDKIYPYYKSLGGNSDIHSKYSEISQVYSEVTKENYKNKRKNKKTTTTKQVENKEGEL